MLQFDYEKITKRDYKRYDFILGDEASHIDNKAEFIRKNMTIEKNGSIEFLPQYVVGLNIEQIKRNDRELIKLNSLLSVLEQNQEVRQLEQEMYKIQAKKNVTVKEFSDIYNISKTSQRDYCSRLTDPLPYHQKVAGGKIVYVVEEVEQWFQNQHR